MKQYLKFLMLLMLSIIMAIGINSCGKESSGGIEPTPVNPTPNNGGGDKPDPTKPDNNPIGDGKVKVFEQVVAVQESEITSVKSDTAAHHYTITYNNAAPEIKPGNVVVVQDGDDVRIILVTDAKINGNTAELDGPLGDLSYVFYDTEFTVVTNPAALDTATGNVYLADRIRTKDGVVRSKSSLSKVGGTFTLLDKTFECHKALEKRNMDKDSVWVDFSLNTRLDLTAVFSFSKPVETLRQGLKFVKAGDFIACFSLSGNFVSKVDIGAHMESEAVWDEITGGDNSNSVLLKNNFIGSHFIDVQIGAFPLVIEFGADAFAEGKITSRTSIDTKISLKDSIAGEVGVVHSPVNGFQFVNRFSNDWFPPELYLHGEADVTFSLSVYPLFHFYIYDEHVGGPGIAVKPTINTILGVGTTLSTGFGNDNFNDDTYFSNTLKVTADLDLMVGWAEPVIFASDIYLERWDEIGTLNVFKDAVIYESPFGIRLKSLSTDQIVKGEPVDVKFNVLAKWFRDDWNTVTMCPSVVRIQSLEGYGYLFVTFGEDTYRWIPSSNDDFLEMVVFDYQGNKLGSFCVGEKHEPRSNVLCFTAVDDFASVSLYAAISGYDLGDYNLEYSYDNKKWSEYTIGEVIPLPKKGSSVYFRGENSVFNNVRQGGSVLRFDILGDVDVSGSVMSLLDGTGDGTYLPEKCTFFQLFKNTPITTAPDLPAIALDETNCYMEMFCGCTKLEDSPVIAARKLTQGAFTNMFNGCTSLKNVHISFNDWLDDATALWLKDVAPNGNIVCPAELPVIFDESHIPTGWTINGKHYNINLTVDVYDTETFQNDELFATCSTNIPCSVIVYIDGDAIDTIMVKKASSIKLPTDIIGTHNVKIAIYGDVNESKTFSYTVTRLDTPATGNTTVPDVSGTDIDQKNTGSGYAPNVNGQNVNSEYNSGGNTPSVKGQNLDQYYNGGGSTPDIKGTNL